MEKWKLVGRKGTIDLKSPTEIVVCEKPLNRTQVVPLAKLAEWIGKLEIEGLENGDIQLSSWEQ